MDNNINIYVAAHKKADFPDNKIYVPIHVGSEGKEDLGYVKDNTGDNISTKNPNYCELTGMYWIWKNDNSRIVGLAHYRRYFFKNIFTNKLKDVIDEKEINDILEKYDMIVPNKNKLVGSNIKDFYCKYHKEKDLEECRNIISEKYPDYINAFDEVMMENSFYICNMIITKKKIFDDYCEWLFNVLFELENRTDISDYDDYNKRIYGFLSERLFNVWLKKNNDLKIKEMPVYNTDKGLTKQLISNVIKKII